jgi:hypothetical protein
MYMPYVSKQDRAEYMRRYREEHKRDQAEYKRRYREGNQACRDAELRRSARRQRRPYVRAADRTWPTGDELRHMREQFEARFRMESGCWWWAGALTGAGYGSFRFKGQVWLAHRVAYTLYVGPIPERLVLDHLCYQRACVHPAHLEPVSSEENTRRGHVHRSEVALLHWEAAIRAELELHPQLRTPVLARRLGIPEYYAYMIGNKVRAERRQNQNHQPSDLPLTTPLRAGDRTVRK